MSRVNPVTLSDKMSQLERGPLFKSDFRQICSVHRSSELSCTFYPELFPSTILSNHLHYSKIMWSDSTVTPPSPKSKKITKFHSQMGYYIQGQNDSWKCQRNLKKKKLLGATHLLLTNWWFLVWELLDFTDFQICLPFSVVQDVMFIAILTAIKYRRKLANRKLWSALPKQFTALLKI